MAVVIDGTAGIIDVDGGSTLSTADIATQAEAQAGTNNTKVMTPLRTDEAILSQFNVTGSAPTYACRAWVNFNGVDATPTIRGSGNVTSITDLGTGTYTVNLTTAMPDANYAAIATAGDSVGNRTAAQVSDLTVSSFRIYVINHGNAFAIDGQWVSAAVFR